MYSNVTRDDAVINKFAPLYNAALLRVTVLNEKKCKCNHLLTLTIMFYCVN